MERKTFIYLLMVVLFAIIVRLIFFSGIGASDSVYYTKYANDISNNNFPTEDKHLNSRIGFLIPVSFLYGAFGVNDFSSVLFPLITSILGIFLIFFLGKLLFDEKTALVAAFLLSFYPLDVIYSTKLLADLPSAFFSGLSIFLFLNAEKINIKSKSYLLYAASGLSLGMAFMIKEMAILTSLFFIGYGLYNRKVKIDYIALVIGFLFVLLLGMGFFYFHTGDPFFRSSVADKYVESALFQDSYGRLLFPKFFVTWPYVIFGSMQLGYFFTFIALATLYYLSLRKKETNYLLIWFLFIVLYFYFGTASPKQYLPVPAVIRFLSYITFPSILLLAAFMMEQHKIIKRVIFPFVVIFLLFTSISAVYLDNSRNSLSNLRLVYSEIKTIEKPIYTDYRSIMVLDYISGYKSNLNLIDLDSDPKNLKNVEDSHIVINNKMIKGIVATNKNFEFLNEIEKIPDNWIKVREIGKTDEKIIIYYAK